MKKIIFYVILFFSGFALLNVPKVLSTESSPVHIIQLEDDTINPITAEYISKAITQAEDEKAQCLIIKLDTPGGLLNSTRLIVKKIMASQVPIVVYIAPSGSRAGSAGVFITYASHIAAMAPSTNIGAAHPVQMGREGGKSKDKGNFWEELQEMLADYSKEAGDSPQTSEKENITADEQTNKETPGSEPEAPEEIVADDDPMSSKILQDTVAFIRSIAKKRNRNIEWAIKSVTKSLSITETEALDLDVIEIIAKDDQELLEKLDGRTVTIDDKEIVLQTKNAPVKRISMDFRQKLFNILANPNIAYILMILGFYGLLYEITHPGIGVPGILGAIFLILAFFSMQTLPTNYAGVALVLLGLILLIAEAATPGLGLLLLGGMVSLVLGSLLLFDSSDPIMRVSLNLIITIAMLAGLFSLLIVRAVIRALRKKATTGKEGLVGMVGVVRTNINANQEGKIFVHGELWNAISTENIKKGDKVEVLEMEGLLLTVKKVKN